MRIPIGAPARIGDADKVEHVNGMLVRLIAGIAKVELGDLHQLAGDAHERVQRRHRILKDHRYFAAAQICQFIHVHFEDILVVEVNFATDDFTWGIRYQPHHGKRCNALAAATFTYHTQGLTRHDCERNIIDCLHNASTCKKVCLKVIYLKQMLCHVHSSAS